MRRVLAVLGAVLMVTLALLVRSLIDGDEDGGQASGEGGNGDVPTLVCAEELADVCERLERDGAADVTIEPVGETVDRLGAVDAELDADGWLTLDPFPQQVDERREFATGSALFGDSVATDRSSGLALVAFADRAAALEADCPDVDWACLGDAAGEPWADHGGESSWGEVKPGYDAPDTSATGLLVLAQAMAAHLDDPGFAGQDIDDRWLGDLEDAVPTRTAGTALLKLVQQGRAAFGAVGALGIEAEAVAGTAQGEDLTIFYPAPMFRASVVLAPRRGVDASELIDADNLDAALAEAGWESDATGEPLPSAGVLDALRSAWENV
ncbi:MAG TPA: hypothetical protein VIT24_02390 [Acidimicrobiales bacterium]